MLLYYYNQNKVTYYVVINVSSIFIKKIDVAIETLLSSCVIE